MEAALCSRRHALGIAAVAASWHVWAQSQQSNTELAGSRPVALLVGNTRYRPSNRSILTAHKNVRNLEDVLTDMGYDVKPIFDASKQDILSSLDEVIAKSAKGKPLFMYFCGHGINSLSKGEYRNYWLSTGLQVVPPAAAATDAVAKREHFERLALASPSLEEDIFPRLASARTDAQSFIMVDACRELAGVVSDIDATLVQSRPPSGCLVGYATSPGRFALTPDDPDRNSYFAESLIEQLKGVSKRSNDEGDMTQVLQRVRIQVRERVNAIAKAENSLEYLLGLTGQKTGYIQEPTYASSISDKAVLRPDVLVALARPPVAMPPPVVVSALPVPAVPIGPIAPPAAVVVQPPLAPVAVTVGDGADVQRWAQIETLVEPDAAEAALLEFTQTYPTSRFKENAVARLEDVRRVKDAVRKTRLLRVPLNLAAVPAVQPDYKAALQGDKFAAQRVSEAVSKHPALGDAATALRWLQFSGELGNGIAAYSAFLRFNSMNLLQEATYHLALAQTNGYRPPKDFDARK